MLYNKNTEEVLYNAMAYYRLSKYDGRKNKSDSIGNQRKFIHEYVKKHDNITLIDESYDDGYTGTNYDRPGFNKVLEAIESGKINCVIVKDLSRLGREYIETGKYIEMVFPSKDVRFIAINDDVDSAAMRTGDDIIIPVKNIMNESYCRELSKKLRRQFKLQRENGEFIGAFTSYGYLKSPEDKHLLIIDEYAAEVVRSIFSLKLQGYSQNGIADFLNETGVLPPAEYKKSIGLNYKSGFKTTNKALWNAMTVRRILMNDIYIGNLTQGKTGTPNYKIKKVRPRSEDEWVVVKDNHKAIINPLMFNTVQKILLKDTRTSPYAKTVSPLSGVVFCADCKSPMKRRSVARGHKTFHYYMCSQKNGEKCTGHNLAVDKFEGAVLNAIRNQINLVIELDSLIESIGKKNILSAKIRHVDMMIEKINKDIEKYHSYKMNLHESLADNIINRDEYAKMHGKYTALIEEANAALKKLNEERSEIENGSETDEGFIAEFIKYRDINTLNREVVVTLIDNIYVFEDKHIKIEFNYRDEIEYYQSLIEKFSKEAG